VCLLLALITLALYNPVNRHPFVNYDDDRYVTQNPHVREGLSWESVSWAITSTEQANWHPLTWMSHELDCSLFRLNPAGHHFTSAVVHAVNVILLFLLLIGATGRIGPSLFVALLFAVHPINVESVAWVAERKNVLCTLFFLLTLQSYGWYARKPGWMRYLAVFTLFGAGLASKPMVITLPFVLLLWDYWPLARIRGSGAAAVTASPHYSIPKLVLEKVPLFALSAASAVITMQAQQAGGAVRSTEQISLGVRMATSIYAYGMYLWKMVWPENLAPLYPHPGNSLATWQVAVAGLVLIGISAGIVRFREHRYLLVGWLWFLGTLVPVIGLVQVGDAAMADRYAYIPLIGIFIAVAYGAAEIADAKGINVALSVAPAAVVLIVMALMTLRQIGFWQDSIGLWTHALAVTTNNYIAEDNLGGALILEGREEEAFPHFQAAAHIRPQDPMSRSNVGSYYMSHGRMQDAISEYGAAISLTSDAGLLAQAYANLGSAQLALGQDGEAQKSLSESLRLNSTQVMAWLGLGVLAQKQGKSSEAISDLSRSIELQPTAIAYLQLGRALQQVNRRAEALAAYEQALKIDPNMAEAQRAAAELGGSGR
jgi:tetratricopeptide (TPR) repeat protein